MEIGFAGVYPYTTLRSLSLVRKQGTGKPRCFALIVENVMENFHMLTPIDPRSLYVIHKDRERELERNLELMRIAKEQGSVTRGVWAQIPALMAVVVQSLKRKLFRRANRLPETL